LVSTRAKTTRDDEARGRTVGHEGRLYIGGEWIAPSAGDGIDVISPHTEEVIARAPAADPADVDRAVAAACAAIDEGPWPRHDQDCERGHQT
jgi:acyl-CoA reductase-like NAD-dependent aldehyde dehydrogenase